MLAVRLICVGKLGEKFWKEAAAEYEKRLKAYCKLEIVELPEQRISANPSHAEIAAALEKEKELIKNKILSGSLLIAMCIEGKTMSSEGLAKYLKDSTISGTSKISILIGGSCGMDESLKQEAELKLSISPMTFPHHMARIMVLEQVYRAMNIINGGKYHK